MGTVSTGDRPVGDTAQTQPQQVRAVSLAVSTRDCVADSRVCMLMRLAICDWCATEQQEVLMHTHLAACFVQIRLFQLCCEELDAHVISCKPGQRKGSRLSGIASVFFGFFRVLSTGFCTIWYDVKLYPPSLLLLLNCPLLHCCCTFAA
jgi:hypothetical protein